MVIIIINYAQVQEVWTQMGVPNKENPCSVPPLQKDRLEWKYFYQTRGGNTILKATLELTGMGWKLKTKVMVTACALCGISLWEQEFYYCKSYNKAFCKRCQAESKFLCQKMETDHEHFKVVEQELL